jgi:hypothetical protein
MVFPSAFTPSGLLKLIAFLSYNITTAKVSCLKKDQPKAAFPADSFNDYRLIIDA